MKKVAVLLTYVTVCGAVKEKIRFSSYSHVDWRKRTNKNPSVVVTSVILAVINWHAAHARC